MYQHCVAPFIPPMKEFHTDSLYLLYIVSDSNYKYKTLFSIIGHKERELCLSEISARTSLEFFNQV